MTESIVSIAEIERQARAAKAITECQYREGCEAWTWWMLFFSTDYTTTDDAPTLASSQNDEQTF